VVASGPRLLVPRNDGFWWLDAVGGTYYDSQPEGYECSDTLVVADTMPAREDEYDSRGSPSILYARPANPARTARTDSVNLGNGELKVHWVGNDRISMTQTSTDNREHLYESNYLVSLDALRDSALSYGGGELDIGTPALEKAAQQCANEFRQSWRRATGEDLEDLSVNNAWIVLRRQTNWSLEIVQGRNLIVSDEPGGCPVPREAARELTGYDRVSVPWRVIKNALPAAKTAFESPAHDLLLVRDGKMWYAFIPNATSLGRPLARIAIDGEPVMSQWAVGAHAARWAREAAELLRAGR
jgi:hypothetical protein